MLKKLIFFISLILIFIFNSGFTVVGHRGDPIKAPEETFQSFDTAFSEGADYVELDVHLSKDNILVISHDKNLERITNQNYTVSQTNFSTLSQLKVANGENIHSLNQVFDHYKDNPNAKFLIETKKTKKGNPKEMEAILANVIKEYNMQDRVMFHTFSEESLIQLKKYLPEVPRIFIFGTLHRLNFEILKYIDGVNVSSKLLTPELITQLHYLHKKVYVWDEMNENPDQWNWLVNLPIDGVVTNFPGTGNKYRNLKNNSVNKNVNQELVYTQINPTPFYENPYIKNKITGYAKNMETYNITKAIYINNNKFYEIGNEKYISADGFNTKPETIKLVPYFNSKIRSKPTSTANVYARPSFSEKNINVLKTNTYYPVEGIQKDGSLLWYKISSGWISSKDTLLRFNNGFNYQSYINLVPKNRISNIDLSFSLPVLNTKIYEKNDINFLNSSIFVNKIHV